MRHRGFFGMATVSLCLLLGAYFADLAGGSARLNQDENAARPPASNPCDGCWIGGRCYPAKSHNPKESCQICIPEWSKTRWSYTDQSPCSDGIASNGSDWCLGGKCVGHRYFGLCTNNGPYCKGYYAMDVRKNECVWQDPPCADDGVICNGVEFCIERSSAPVPYECRRSPPGCQDDGSFCNGTTSCNQETQGCEETKFPCPDDGLFCNGFEACDEDKDACVHIGAPCRPTEICDEKNDECLARGNDDDNDDDRGGDDDKFADKSQGCGA